VSKKDKWKGRHTRALYIVDLPSQGAARVEFGPNTPHQWLYKVAAPQAARLIPGVKAKVESHEDGWRITVYNIGITKFDIDEIFAKLFNPRRVGMVSAVAERVLDGGVLTHTVVDLCITDGTARNLPAQTKFPGVDAWRLCNQGKIIRFRTKTISLEVIKAVTATVCKGFGVMRRQPIDLLPIPVESLDRWVTGPQSKDCLDHPGSI
jgi:hypothetical protein